MDTRKPTSPPPGGRQMPFNIGYIFVALLAMWLFQEFVLAPLALRATEIGYSDFKKKLTGGQVVEVTIGHDRIQGVLKDDKGAKTQFTTVFTPDGDPKLTEELDKADVKYTFERPSSPIGGILISWILPLALLFGFYMLAARRMSAAGGGPGRHLRRRQEQGDRGEARGGRRHLQGRRRRRRGDRRAAGDHPVPQERRSDSPRSAGGSRRACSSSGRPAPARR